MTGIYTFGSLLKTAKHVHKPMQSQRHKLLQLVPFQNVCPNGYDPLAKLIQFLATMVSFATAIKYNHKQLEDLQLQEIWLKKNYLYLNYTLTII